MLPPISIHARSGLSTAFPWRRPTRSIATRCANGPGKDCSATASRFRGGELVSKLEKRVEKRDQQRHAVCAGSGTQFGHTCRKIADTADVGAADHDSAKEAVATGGLDAELAIAFEIPRRRKQGEAKAVGELDRPAIAVALLRCSLGRRGITPSIGFDRGADHHKLAEAVAAIGMRHP